MELREREFPAFPEREPATLHGRPGGARESTRRDAATAEFAVVTVLSSERSHMLNTVLPVVAVLVVPTRVTQDRKLL